MTDRLEQLVRGLDRSSVGDRFIAALEGPPEPTLLSPSQLIRVMQAGAGIAEDAQHVMLEWAIRRSGADDYEDPIPDVSVDALSARVVGALEGDDRVYGVLSDDARGRVDAVAGVLAAEIAEASESVTIRLLGRLDRLVRF